jgi:hypothetical protein
MLIVVVERKTIDLFGAHHLTEYNTYKTIVKHKQRVNTVFAELGGTTPHRLRPPGTKSKMQPPRVTSSEEIGTSSKPRKKVVGGFRIEYEELFFHEAIFEM